MRYAPRWPFWSLIVAMLVLLPGCPSVPVAAVPELAPAASIVKPATDATTAAVNAEKPLAGAEAAASKLPDSPARVELTKQLAAVRTWWAGNLAAWRQTVETAKKIDQSIKDRDNQIVTLKKDVTVLQ